jgi:tRNA uridine 5-carbamoylmethylation protein Kti12
MVDTKIIILEGLPSTGKSTNSDFLRMQLERNCKKVKWIHEVTRPHPILLFSEACLNYNEYEYIVKKFPQTAQILSSIAVFRKNIVSIDLLEIEWNYMDIIGELAIEAIKKFDSWNFTIDRYMEITLEKWEYFSNLAINDKDTIYIYWMAVFFKHKFLTFYGIMNHTNHSKYLLIKFLIL